MRVFLALLFSLCASLSMVLAGCGERATLPVRAGTGPNPTLPSPHPTPIPTVNIAPVDGWPAGMSPTPAAGLAVNAFATDLDHPRWLYVLPNGDVLVAETNAPPKPEDGKGIKGWAMKKLMKRAGSGTPSANRITLLRDADGDGVAETRTVFLDGLESPFGMALIGVAILIKIDPSELCRTRRGRQGNGIPQDVAAARRAAERQHLREEIIEHHDVENAITVEMPGGHGRRRNDGFGRL